jgi:glycosyltransferase involved in cell wall biosynthesis
MINDRKIVVVLPAFNAEKTIEKTYSEIPFDIVDDVVLVDDQSSDKTYLTAKTIGINNIIIQDRNKGYGSNQKTCYNKALELGADIVIMLHPDYQYTPRLIHSMCFLISNDFVFDNQILAQICFLNYGIGEVSCPTKYDDESSSINFWRSVTYGIGVMKTSFSYFAAKTIGVRSKIFR